MQIIIPMSGYGERFRRAGFNSPKPLIEVDGKPIIAHVVDLFPGELDFIFVCNNEHLSDPTLNLRGVLSEICPTGKIVGIDGHRLGPIHAIQQARELLDPDRPVVVNYCDFSCFWDWAHFKNFVTETSCDGAIPAYRGFHPHSLGTTNYAYLKDMGGWALDIQEKKPFTSDRTQEYASSGTYYFATARLMLSCFDTAVARNLSVGGEFYVSLAYKVLFDCGSAVAIYPLQHFMQWGTPEDLNEYIYWSNAFKSLLKPQPAVGSPIGTIIVPMAGLGSRFSDQGYTDPKPLIDVSGSPMVLQAVRALPKPNYYCFVVRSNTDEHKDVDGTLLRAHPGSHIEYVPNVTEGQACSAWAGMAMMNDQMKCDLDPVTFGSCDFGSLYDTKEYERLLSSPEIDVIVWGIRGYANAIRNPSSYGWIEAKENRILSISVKSPLSSVNTDPITLGTFTFRRASDFEAAYTRLIERQGKVNGEYYLDSCINDAIDLGLNCHLFEVDYYFCWGTPSDLHTFEYWQSCFHKWSSHPYKLERDSKVSSHQIAALSHKYRAQRPSIPDAKSQPRI